MGTLESLQKFILSEIALKLGKKSLEPDEDLLEQGIIDSLGITKVIVFLENAFRISIDDDEIVPENFQNLNSIVRLVEQKTGNS